jgi:dihydroorotase
MLTEKETIIIGGTLVTAEEEKKGAILIKGERIANIWEEESMAAFYLSQHPETEVIEAVGKHVFAGGIDAHVHFREPGLTAKADMESESAAAVLGGVTSFIDMPNTNPQTTTAQALEQKLALAEGRCHANYGFHIGATNSNYSEIKAIPSSEYAGIKVFMGSSTGNMLVNEGSSLEEIFADKEKPVLVHCEDEDTINANLQAAKGKYGDSIPFEEHPNIRSRMACFKSSMKALELAMKHGTKLHLCHISTREEAEMARAAKLHNPNITIETSPNYLWFSSEDYKTKGARVKCNPSIKTADDRQELRTALLQGSIDTIGTDHAPHLAEEKEKAYTSCPSGMPSIQHSLPVLLTLSQECEIPLTRIASAFSEKPAEIFNIKDRGKLKEGYFADIVIVDLNGKEDVSKENLAYKCGWSPYEGETFSCSIDTVLVGGVKAVDNGKLTGNKQGKKLKFN